MDTPKKTNTRLISMRRRSEVVSSMRNMCYQQDVELGARSGILAFHPIAQEPREEKSRTLLKMHWIIYQVYIYIYNFLLLRFTAIDGLYLYQNLGNIQMTGKSLSHILFICR